MDNEKENLMPSTLEARELRRGPGPVAEVAGGLVDLVEVFVIGVGVLAARVHRVADRGPDGLAVRLRCQHRQRARRGGAGEEDLGCKSGFARSSSLKSFEFHH